MFDDLIPAGCLRPRNNTCDEIIAVASHYRDGGTVEWYSISEKKWFLFSYKNHPCFDFNTGTYRVA